MLAWVCESFEEFTNKPLDKAAIEGYIHSEGHSEAHSEGHREEDHGKQDDDLDHRKIS